MDIEAVKKLYEELQATIDERYAARGSARNHFAVSTNLVPSTCPIVRNILDEWFPDDFRPESNDEVEHARDRAFNAIQDQTNCRFRNALEDTILEQWELVDKLGLLARRLYDLLPEEYEVNEEFENVE